MQVGLLSQFICVVISVLTTRRFLRGVSVTHLVPSPIPPYYLPVEIVLHERVDVLCVYVTLL